MRIVLRKNAAGWPPRSPCGALRYFMLKYTRNSVIAFDFGEALAFTGETGVYVQYAAVRAGKILGKLRERGEALPDFRAELTPEAVARQLTDEKLWQALLAASKVDSAIGAGRLPAAKPAHVARYAFQLAQAYSNFYQEFPVFDRGERGKENIPIVDDRILPRAAGTDARRVWHRSAGIHVGRASTPAPDLQIRLGRCGHRLQVLETRPTLR